VRPGQDDLAVPAQPAISPDGATVGYAVTTVDGEADERRTALWRVPAGRGEPVRRIPLVDRDRWELDLVPVRDGVFAVRPPGAQTWFPVTFYQLPDGTPYLHHGNRATPKVAS
jgi:hypothetical protein